MNLHLGNPGKTSAETPEILGKCCCLFSKLRAGRLNMTMFLCFSAGLVFKDLSGMHLVFATASVQLKTAGICFCRTAVLSAVLKTVLLKYITAFHIFSALLWFIKGYNELKYN